jgi:predicted permease
MRLHSFFEGMTARVKSWARAVTRRGRLEAEMQIELASHLEALTADLVSDGHAPEEAARRARIALGAMTAHKEGMRASLGLRWWDELRADLRYAGRLLRKSPGFTLIAAGSLALAIGANSTIFAVGRQMLFGRVTIPHPEELRILRWVGDDKMINLNMWGEFDFSPSGSKAPIFSYPMYQQLKAENHELGDLVAFKDDDMNATVHGDAQQAKVNMVSGNFYEQMQVRVQLGRPIEPSDDVQSGAGAVVVISDSLWARKYGRSPAVLGQVIRVNQQLMTIIGVNPRGFTGIRGAMESPDLFVPISMQPVIDPKSWSKQPLLTAPKNFWVNLAARTRPGVTDNAAQAAFAARFEAGLRATYTLKQGKTLPRLLMVDGSRGLHPMDETVEKPIYVLFGFTGLLLLLACVNVANLLLARGAQRQRELNVRMAMGALRGRIVRQLFTESLLLAGLGGVGGLLLSLASRNILPRLLADPWETTTTDIPFDWRVFGFTMLMTFATAAIFGLLPAWLAARNEASSQLKESSHQMTKRRRAWSGKGVVALQIALSTVLVIGAGVFLRTVIKLNSVDLGFDSSHVLMFDIQPPESKYAGGKDVQLHQQLEQKLAALPGVESVAPAAMPLAAGGMRNFDFVTEDKSTDDKNPSEYNNTVGNDYFHTMRIPIIAGRTFGPQDTKTSVKVAVINEALAKKRFPNGNPIGKRFSTDDPPKGEWIQVVGICADTRYAQVKDDPPPVFYLPYVQQEHVGGMTYQLRTHTSAAALVPAIEKIVRQFDPDLPLIDVRTEREQIDATMQTERAFATLTVSFGVLALALACVGIYGIMAYTVSQRRNEIGIRMALGAQPAQVRSMILGESTWLAGWGIAVGVVAALGLTQLVKSMLYGIQPHDPMTMIGGVLILLIVALAASWIPARRAARVQPMEALRHE